MADMIYEITIDMTVKITLSSEERAEAIALGIKDGLILQEDIDRGTYTDELAHHDVILYRAKMGKTELANAVRDWLDDIDEVDLANGADVTAYKETIQ
jgi:hypothetical protein